MDVLFCFFSFGTGSEGPGEGRASFLIPTFQSDLFKMGQKFPGGQLLSQSNKKKKKPVLSLPHKEAEIGFFSAAFKMGKAVIYRSIYYLFITLIYRAIHFKFGTLDSLGLE